MRSASVDIAFPEMDTSSAAYPTVRESGASLHLAYYVPGCDDSALATFVNAESWSYGEPNDEGLRSHPLWGHGLTPYNLHLVGSSGTAMRQHWVATFHDGTLEVLAVRRRIDAKRVVGLTPREALLQELGPGLVRVLDETA